MSVYCLRALLAGCVLCFCYPFGEASPALIRTLVAVTLHKKILAFEQPRYKREFMTKMFEDPESCLSACDRDEESQIDSVISKHSVITTPMFDEICTIKKDSSRCYTKCPVSHARTILTINHEVAEAAACEPSKWTSFQEFWTALNCTNTTLTRKPCAHICGPELTIKTETKLKIESGRNTHLSPPGAFVKYETDAGPNTDAANRACRSLSCHAKCYKPILTQTCGAKAYDWFVRRMKVYTHARLATLKTLNAIGQPDDCKQYSYEENR